MNPTYYLLRALAADWQDLVGYRLEEAFSQQRDELTLAFESPDGHVWRVQVGVRPVYLFRSEGYNRARRNTASLFESGTGKRVEAVRLAARDRVLLVDLEDGLSLHFFLFGPRANAFLVEADGTVAEAFQADAAHAGQPAPQPRPAPEVADAEAFRARWPASGPRSRRLARALPLFDAPLAAEVLFRAGLADTDEDLDDAALDRVFQEAQRLESALAQPRPHLYRSGSSATLALVAYQHLGAAGWQEEPFDRVDDAVRVFVRERLRGARFHGRYDALRQRLDRTVEKARARLDGMLEHLTRPSRADDYERDAHLLMAHPNSVPPAATSITLPDFFADGAPRHITLDPALTAVENAEKRYARARQTRLARQHAEARLDLAETRLRDAERLRSRLATITTLKDLDAFLAEERDALVTADADEDARLPFRRYRLAGGYEAWVGRSAAENDTLTLRHARPFDLWMHARGVPGSHVVLRLPGRQSQPPPAVLDAAASIAAYHSKARGSSLVPVIVVPRKFVRKPKGAAPGSVTVMKESVRLVEPRLPELEVGG